MHFQGNIKKIAECLVINDKNCAEIVDFRGAIGAKNGSQIKSIMNRFY